MKRTSDSHARRKKIGDEVSSLQIVEEAFHLVRTAPGTTLLLYFFGTVPFVCLLFYFWADMSRSSYAQRDAGLVALGLTLAYFWKCSWQARFCRSLWDVISPGQAPKRRGWQRFRYHAAIWMYQAFAIPAVLLAICFVIPLAWILTAFQNGYAVALTSDHQRIPLRKLTVKAFRNSHYQWAQNHGIWIILGLIGLLAWVNIFAACALPPMAAKAFLGIETVFSMNPEALSNSTFIFGTLLVTYLVLSPLVKAIFVLRCFYAESRTTGADLLSRLAERRKSRQVSSPQISTRPTKPRKAAAIAIGFCLFASSTVLAEDGGGASTDGKITSMDTAIQDTMASKKYQWKFSRKLEIDPAEKELSWLQMQLKNLADAVETRARLSKEWLSEKLEEWFRKIRMRERSDRNSPTIPSIPEGAASFIMSVGWIVLIAVSAGLVGWLGFVLVKYYREAEDEVVDDEVGVADIDLESEDIVADQLAEDEWMKLAREQIEKGESRLAIRALFLATLAHLGDRGLLKIQKFKSNRDYHSELELKARQEKILRAAFTENTGLFERVWYGLHQIGDDSVDHFMKNYETITSDPV